jgi:hypothetical protein
VPKMRIITGDDTGLLKVAYRALRVALLARAVGWQLGPPAGALMLARLSGWQVSSVEDKKVIAKMGTQTRDEAVECMCWAVPGVAEGAEGAEGAENGVEPCNRVFTGRADGVVQLWDVQKQLQVSAPGGAREARAGTRHAGARS